MSKLSFVYFLVSCLALQLYFVFSFHGWGNRIVKSSSFKVLSDNVVADGDSSSGGVENDDEAYDFDSLIKKGFINVNKLDSSPSGDRSQRMNDLFASLKSEQSQKAEQIYRKYPFENMSLPVLSDCNNYYSGKFEDFFWHQNSDQLLVYIPIATDITKSDIKVDFAAKSVRVFIQGEEIVFFECLERIIPDGSFWVIEEDKEGARYIQLDLEKRFRMINWKNLFGEPSPESQRDVEQMRSETLEKLIAANKGLSRLTGAPAETLDDMSDEEISSVVDEVYEEPRIISESDEDDTNDSNDPPQDFIDVETEEVK